MKREEQRHLPNTTETNPNWRKLSRNRPDKDDRHLAYSLLIANGVSKEKAATMLGYSSRTVRSIDRAIEKKGLKLSLLSEQRIKKAHRVLDKLLAGKTFGEIENVKDSTALRAAEVVLDRSDPKAQDVKPPTFSFTQVNLNLARPGHPDCIDITEPPPIDGNLELITEDVEGRSDEEA